jgi:uncharacterized protein YqeY
MALRDQLTEDLKVAMRAGDTARRDTIRLIRSAIQTEEASRKAAASDAWKARVRPIVAERGFKSLEELLEDADQNRHNPDLPVFEEPPALSEPDLVQILQRQAKQRRDSIEAFQKAGREDLAAKEQGELDVIQSYLPQQMPREEIRALAEAAIAEVGAGGPKQMGAVMRVLMPRLAGRAEGREVQAVVTELLAKT